jgi:hypothetical protein
MRAALEHPAWDADTGLMRFEASSRRGLRKTWGPFLPALDAARLGLECLLLVPLNACLFWPRLTDGV